MSVKFPYEFSWSPKVCWLSPLHTRQSQEEHIMPDLVHLCNILTTHNLKLIRSEFTKNITTGLIFPTPCDLVKVIDTGMKESGVLWRLSSCKAWIWKVLLTHSHQEKANLKVLVTNGTTPTLHNNNNNNYYYLYIDMIFDSSQNQEQCTSNVQLTFLSASKQAIGSPANENHPKVKSTTQHIWHSQAAMHAADTDGLFCFFRTKTGLTWLSLRSPENGGHHLHYCWQLADHLKPQGNHHSQYRLISDRHFIECWPPPALSLAVGRSPETTGKPPLSNTDWFQTDTL